MNRRAQARALMAAGASVVALAGCSSLIGLDDFQDAPSAGGSAGAGASGGTSPTGGAAGVAGGGGAAGAGGVAGTGGGSGGSGGTGATGGAAGAGGTGGSGPKVSCAATGSPEVLIPKNDYPKQSFDLVVASDLQSATPSAYIFVDHDWEGQPPSGRTNSEVVGVRVGQDGKAMGNGVKWWDVESPIRLDDAIKLQTAGAPLVVRGNRKSVEQLTIPLNAAGNFVAGANGLAQMNLVTFAPQSKCTVTGGEYLTSKFSTAQAVNFAAVCGDAATRSLQVGTETDVPYTLVTSASTASVDATQYVVPQSGHSLLLQSDGGFRVGTSFQELANSPQFIDLAGAASQQVMGFFPTKTGALALLRRVDTLGVVNLFAATLTSPYTNIKGSPVTALPEVEPPITTSRAYLHIGQSVRIATMTTMPANSLTWVRVIVANEGGEITYQGNVVNASSDLDGTAIAPLSTTGDQWLLVWRIFKGPVLGQTIVCKAI